MAQRLMFPSHVISRCLVVLLAFSLVESSMIYLKSATIEVENQPQRLDGPRRRLAEVVAARNDPRWGQLLGNEQLLVTFHPTASPETVNAAQKIVEEEGGSVSYYLPDHTLLLLGNLVAAERLQQLDGVHWVGEYKPEYKVAPAWHKLQQQFDLGSILEEVRSVESLSESISHLGKLSHAQGSDGSSRLQIQILFPLIAHSSIAPPENATDHLDSDTFDPAAAAIADWSTELRGLFGNDTMLRAEGRRQAILTVRPENLQIALGWLSMQPSVHWLAPIHQSRVHNWQGTAISQSGLSAPKAPLTMDQDGGSHSIWAAGITGQGLVVGGGDSGVDMNHCQFRDPSVTTQSFLVKDDSGVVSFNSTKHRKIRLYRQLADGSDGNGHGTHTMGTLTGVTADDTSLLASDYRGMAPGAKLAFTDLGSSSSDSILTPQALSRDYYPYAYAVGARVHSDSWGSASVEYDYMASEVDLFSWRNQDFVSVLAAGNEGMSSVGTQPQGQTTVTSPATAKNCITVGASLTAGQSLSSSVSASALMNINQITSQGSQQIESFKVLQAEFGGKVSSLFTGTWGLVAADPIEGCTALLNAAAVFGNVVIVQRGTCFFSDKVNFAAAAGAKAVLIFDNQISDYVVLKSSSGDASITVPVMSVPRRVGQLLLGGQNTGQALTASFGETPSVANSFDNIADFSSQGPTTDGRVKPDVVAPGQLQSAYTDPTGNTCALRLMGGTSMATPLVAGSAVLVQDYFKQGFYPTGTAQSNNSYNPSGALVKAILIGGAQGLGGYASLTGFPLAPPPSFTQGFGRVQLSRSLPIKGNSLGWNLQVVDRAKMITGQSDQYCIRSTGGVLSVTLVWHDYPASPGAASALVNDLDLTVRAAGLNGYPFTGNGGGMTNLAELDRTNNVEQVSIAYLPAGAVSIEVKGYRVSSPSGPQPYSLVVLGDFTGTLNSPSNPVGGTAPSGTCAIVVATIASGPTGLTNASTIVYTLSTQSGSVNGVEFECSLENTGGAVNATGTQDWKPCTSPVSYPKLADGRYNFDVRAKGEQIVQSTYFIKDTTPPTATFTSLAPATQSAADTALFSFVGQDTSAVTFQCMIDVDQHGLQASISAVSSENATGYQVVLGQWQACSSPQTYYWLLPGKWSFRARATDAAGNTNVADLTQQWTVQFSSGVTYTRLTSGPFQITALKSMTYAFKAFQAGNSTKATVVEPAAGFECSLVQGSNSTGSQALSVSAASWAPCTSPATATAAADGLYLFSARVADASGRAIGAAAQVSLTVDSTPPVITVAEKPSAIVTSSSVSVQFSSNKPSTTFQCQLIDSDNITQALPYSTCVSPAQLSNLQDGHYTFSIMATDQVGNRALPSTQMFLIDTTAPSISAIQVPKATSSADVTASFLASDGVGSGIVQTQCRMRPNQLMVPGAVDATSSAYGWKNCTSPVTYSSLAEGRWGLTFSATDMAGFVQQSGESAVYVDKTPPSANLTAGPPQGVAVPSKVTFTFATSSGGTPGAGSPVTESQCTIQALTAAQSDELARPSNVTAGTLQYQSVSSTSIKKTQLNCTSPVTFTGLPSGNMTFVLLPVDAAGNVGQATTPFLFLVDASLPVDGVSPAGEGLGWKLYIIIGAAAGVVILAAIGIFLAGRSRARRRRGRAGSPMLGSGNGTDSSGRYEPAMAAALQQSLQPARAPRRARDDEAQVAAAIAASIEEERLRKAIERSLAEQTVANAGASAGAYARQTQPLYETDPDLRAAIQASLEEENYRRAMEASESGRAEHVSLRNPTAPPFRGPPERTSSQF